MKKPKKGLFIALEGIDGSGKGTAIQGLKLEAEHSGYSFFLTKEPTDGAVGKIIREKLQGRSPRVTDSELQRLFVEDRFEHVRDVILPSINNYDFTVCDRYWFSTLAYGIPKLTKEEIVNFHEEIFGGNFLKPNVVFLLDLPAEIALKRIQTNRTQVDHFEKMNKLQKIRQNYLDLANDSGLGKTITIDAQKPPAEIISQIWGTVNEILLKK